LSFAAVFDVALSQTQYDSVRRLYQTTLGSGLHFPPVNLVIEGDSLSAENGSLNDYGIQLLAQPNWLGKFNKHNVAQGGEVAAQMLAEFPTQALPIAVESGRNFLFLWGGANDIKRDYTAANIFATLTTYWQQARNAGFTMVSFTILRTSSDTPDQIANRDVLNNLIRASANQYDYLIDVANIPVLADPTDPTYFADGVHLTPAGYKSVATLINSAIPNP
ncbi:MAG: SGNH/GDSL hydrolase family protein, partial [Verrucomicrobia bacterium]|nr:SGNH/GDSL hydrolase family protein [Verrucomicrobiota bacterium]